MKIRRAQEKIAFCETAVSLHRSACPALYDPGEACAACRMLRRRLHAAQTAIDRYAGDERYADRPARLGLSGCDRRAKEDGCIPSIMS